jgi:DNA-binding transcriptional LysR family regulator
MDLEDLRTFVDVADAGGVPSAARRLGVSKSIVSRRLFRLEAELGVQLLARTTRGAALTEAGVTFREHAARVCAEIDIAFETIMPAGELRGRLRIAAPLSLGPTHLAPVFAEMARRHPLLHVQASYSDRFVDIVGEGFDCAIRIGYLNDSNLIARRVGPVHGKLVASPDYIRAHGLPRPRTNSFRIRRSCRERKPGNFSMATTQSPFIRWGGSKRTTVPLLPLPRSRGSGSRGFLITSSRAI